jgi:hypothetical protein
VPSKNSTYGFRSHSDGSRLAHSSHDGNVSTQEGSSMGDCVGPRRKVGLTVGVRVGRVSGEAVGAEVLLKLGCILAIVIFGGNSSPT